MRTDALGIFKPRLTAFRQPSGVGVSRDDIRFGQKCILGTAVALVAFQVGLYFLGGTSLRTPLRAGVFLVSLAMLIVKDKSGVRHRRSHPAAIIVQVIAAVLAISLLNPDSGGLVAGLAQGALYVAVLAPLIWVGRLYVDRSIFRQLVLILWMFHAASAALGALQVEFPRRFDGALSHNFDDFHAEAMTIELNDQTKIFRPMGLTDSPGGAGFSGVYCIILGLGLLLTEQKLFVRGVVAGTMLLSLFSIYLSHGRTNLIVVAIAAIAMLVVLARRRATAQFWFLGSVLAGITFFGTSMAFAAGGQSTIDRWSSLNAEKPSEVLYENRGSFLDDIVSYDMYQYPLGAGPGRWGMINFYFSTPEKMLWGEIMWQGLLFDGGLPLIGLYIALLALLAWTSWHSAVNAKEDGIGIWGGVLFGYTMAIIAATFAFPVLIKDVGLQLMLLSSCYWAISESTFSPRGRQARSVQIRRRRGSADSEPGQTPAIVT